MTDGLTVGVTFYLHDEPRSIWANGGHQNTVFLVDCLRRCPGVKRVLAINGGPGDEPPAGMLYDGLGLDFVRFEAVADELDVLIECGAQIPPHHAVVMHARGKKVACYKYGNAFVLDMQKTCAGGHNQMVFNGTVFDAVWTNPQHVYTNASYWEAVYRCPVVTLPHLWAPTFLERLVATHGTDAPWGYRPRQGPKRLGIFEPNLEVVKTCHIPMLVADLAYRERPDLIDVVWVTNTDNLRGQVAFQKFHSTLEMAGAKAADGRGVVSCEARYPLVTFLAKHVDVVISWQWENALNYAYYEALHGHYPFIHNSDLLPPEVGYHYHGFDAHDGARQLLFALQHHDRRTDAYDMAADAFLETVTPEYPLNVDAHQAALDQLLAA